jgi:hypothetical protein
VEASDGRHLGLDRYSAAEHGLMAGSSKHVERNRMMSTVECRLCYQAENTDRPVGVEAVDQLPNGRSK